MENEGADKSIGIYTLADIDKFTISEISGAKTNFFNNFNNFSIDGNKKNLQTVFSVMLDILEKYFERQKIEDYKVNGFSFFDYKKSVMFAPDDIRLRKVAENGFMIYSHFIKLIGVEIPTIRLNKKKL